MTGSPQSRPHRKGIEGVLAGLLIVGQLGLDLILGMLAVFVWGASAHEGIAMVFLIGLALAYVVVFVVSQARVAEDRARGLRSPLHWAVGGLLGAAGVSFVYFALLTALGWGPMG